MNVVDIIQLALSEQVALSVKGERLVAATAASGMSDTLRSLVRENKDALTAYLRSLETTYATKLPALRPRDPARPPRASFAQMRLWFLHQLEGGSAQYNNVMQIGLEGPLDVPCLQAAMRMLVARHEMLRTCFREDEGDVYQVIQPPGGFELTVVSLVGLSEAAQADEVQRLARAQAGQGFDLARDLMLRAQVLTLGEQSHVLLLAMHHIASDGWSMGILIRELGDGYRALLEGTASRLEPLPIQYADYAQWQRDWLRGEILENHLDYWRGQLAHLPPVHGFPLDHERPPRQDFAGRLHQHVVSAELLESLKRVCQQHDVTLFMLLQTAFGVLLSRYANEADIVMGTPIAGRVSQEVNGLIGFFVNTLVLRNDFGGNPVFAEVLKRNRQTLLDAYTHQHIPLEMLVDELKPARSLQHSPLFQITFALQNMDKAEFGLSGLQATPARAAQDVAKFDLELVACEVPGGLVLQWNHNAGLFEAPTIERAARNYEVLLRAIVDDAQAGIRDLPLIDAPEQARLLREWNVAPVPYRSDKCLHELFEEQAARTPDAIAVEFEDRRLSYAELNARANRLAHHLAACGVRADELVGVCVERSVDMVVGLLGILKAGGAYLPIDPAYPAERVRHMLADSAVELVVTQGALVAPLAQHARRVVCLDDASDDAAVLASLPTHDLSRRERNIDPACLAYVIYTSGSTGLPKGVMISHAAAVNHMDWMLREFAIGSQDVVLQRTAYSFDASVWEFWVPLISGARLVIANAAAQRDIEPLIERVIASRVTVLQTVPAILATLTDLLPSAVSSRLRLVFCGGDVLTPQMRATVRARLPGCELVNLYGPTEATIDATAWRDHGDARIRPARIPIGRPIQNTRVIVVDEALRLVPQGAAGELCIGGAGLARGYLRREALTQQKFVANPHAADPHDRMYRTGDLVRWLPDGNLEFLGRLDHQVKIRGFRIELGEIEHRLASMAQVRGAVVMAPANKDGLRQLVAYVVPQQPLADDAARGALIAACRAQLLQALPEHMVPAVYVFLDALPLNAHGKVDRKALPAAQDSDRRELAYVAARDPVEKSLCDIWQEVLGLERVGIHDNFFSLGGDSILSILVVSRARKHRLGLTVRTLFEHQTVAQLAKAVSVDTVMAIDQAPVRDDLELLPIQRDFIARGLARPNHYNQALLLECPAEFDGRALRAIVDALHERHDALRVRYLVGASGLRAVHRELDERTREAAVACHDLSALDAAQRATALERLCDEAQRSLDIARGPLLRAVHFDFGPGRPGRLLWAIHHLAVDGVSWRVLLSDLGQAWHQFKAGRPVVLGPKTASYRDWGVALGRHAQGPALQQERDFWLRQLAATATAPSLGALEPGDVAAPAAAASASLELGAEQTRMLLGPANQPYRTRVEELLLAALLCAWRECSGQGQLCVELEGHGREDVIGLDVSETMGWFTSTYPLLLEGPSDLAGVLKAVKARCREVPHKGIGYGILRTLCGDVALQSRERERAGRKVVFNYLGQFGGSLDGAGGFGVAAEGCGASSDPANVPEEFIGIDGMVQAGRLRFVVRSARASAQAVHDLCRAWQAALERIVEHCAHANPEFTPADFPNVRLGAEELEALQRRYPRLQRLYPTTPMQAGMLFHGLLDEPGAYTTQICCDLVGDLDTPAFKAAWRQVVRRHDVLRTCFVDFENGQMHQLVQDEVELPIFEHDLSEAAPAEQVEALQAYRAHDKASGFDFAQAPLMRISLLRLSAGRCHFVWTHHHTLMDGWSVPILLREVMEFYEAALSSRAARVEDVVPYERYVAALLAQDRDGALDFWRDSLKGFESATTLGIEQPAADGGENRELVLGLSLDASRRLNDLARRVPCTMNVVLQAAWSLLLQRYSGARDVVFGTTLSGRMAWVPGIEGMVGLFINTVPVLARFEAGMSLDGLLRQLHEGGVAREEHSHVSLAEIQGRSELGAGASLFDSLLVFENYPAGKVGAEAPDKGLAIERVHADEQTGYGITLSAHYQGLLTIKLLYRSDRYTAESMQALLGHLERILTALAHSEPSQRVDDLAMLDAAESQQLLVGFNETASKFSEGMLHERFEAQVCENPAATAVMFGGESLSYAELDRRANGLAHRLVALGVQPDDRVAICMERSLELVVGVLGILKSGAGYVPMDPAYPEERLAYMLQDCAPKALVSHAQVDAGLLSRLVDGDRCPLLDARACADGQDLAPRVRGLTPSRLAYVIYTSGSTGQPKGVEVEHRNVLNLLDDWHAGHTPSAQQDIGSLWTSIGFDVSVWELFGQLAFGGALAIVPDDERADPDRFVAWLRDNEIRTAYLPPFVARELHRHVHTLSLERVLAGVEPIASKALTQAVANKPGLRLVFAYGPTETTVYSIANAAFEQTDRNAPIGRPIANTQVYLLDEQRRPVPVGVPGELYIGGAGVARGYLDRTALTAERFVANPFHAGRMYKTGDLARRLPDGDIEFIGRNDFQVKIRGFRVELGEIEARLVQCADVREAVVLARDRGEGGKQLVAYVVPQALPAGESGRADLIGHCVQHLQATLPDYMVPAAYVLLESLPQTVNGKVDRKRLPEPDESDLGQGIHVAPRNAVEARVCELWQDVLGLQRVGVHDNFFELGGHSLLATQLVGRIRKQFGVEVALRSLFQQPTVQGLARLLDEQASGDAHAPSAIVPAPAGVPVQASFAQQRLWFIDRLEGGSAQYNVPAALDLEGELHVASLRAALGRIVARHDVLRTCFEERQGEVWQRVEPAGEFPLALVSLEALPADRQAEEVQRLARSQATTSFDLGSDRMLRAQVLKLGERRHVLLLTLHHIAADGWSLGVFINELSELYGAEVQGRPAALEPLPIQYADFARWQRDWLRGDVLEEQLGYWKTQLAGLPQVHAFPLDRPRPAAQSFAGRTRHQLVGAPVLQRLKALCRRHDVTLFMLLQTAFSVLLHRYSNVADIVVGTPIAGRTREETGKLIGLFVNTLVLRNDLGGTPTFLDALRKGRQTLLDAYAWQHVPFEMLVDELRPQRSLQHSTLFQIMFNLQNQAQGELALSGLTVRPSAASSGVAKFDLELAGCEVGEGLAFQWHYNTDLFDDETIERVSRNYEVLLDGVLEDVECRICDLPLLSESEARRLLVDWNATAADYPRDRCIHELVEAQVARTPDAVAVVSEDRQLSYAELNRRANRLAHELVALGVKPDALVGLCVERSPEMVIGILGILKAGGAYVPVDPGYPTERIRYMLEDSGVEVVVTQRALLPALPLAGQRTICLDAAAGEADDRACTNLPRDALALRPDHLAYIIYTSGSTGNPKGSLLNHRSIVNLLAWYVQRFALAPADTALVLSSLSFDLTQKNIFGPLIAGGRVSTYASQAYETRAIRARIERDAVTFINCAPSSFYPLVAEPSTYAQTATLRTVLLGGEAINLKLLRPWMQARTDGLRLVNMYGPSECSDISLFHEIAQLPQADQATLPIGRPNWNVKCVVLDEHRRPVPIGVIGELYVGGEGLSRGYLNQEAMTREKFVPNTVALLGGGERLYRTGDLVRWNAGGDVEFIGRADSQVKVRGFRVELGEIEHKLRAHPGIAEAVVLLRKLEAPGAADDAQLVAYVVPAQGGVAAAGNGLIAGYRQHLGGLLPPFMVPAGFVLLDAMPLSPNGKIDRAALAARHDVDFHRAEFVAPRNDVEHALCEIWREMFRVDRVGVEDDFFDIGGHSLLATRLIGEVRTRLGVDLEIREIFTTPTVAGLAACLLPRVRYQALQTLNAPSESGVNDEIFIE